MPYTHSLIGALVWSAQMARGMLSLRRGEDRPRCESSGREIQNVWMRSAREGPAENDGAARLSQALGQKMMEAFAWDGAAEHLAQFRAEIEATEKASNPTTD
jgi:hypothetical protein